jgi:hypothetical protein
MSVRQKEPIGREQDTGPTAAVPSAAYAQVDDGRLQLLGDAHDDARLGVEGVGLLARRLRDGRIGGDVGIGIYPKRRTRKHV